MGSQQEPMIPLKILVDKQSNKVVAVEATKDFVDTLFSFLTLPLGTIIRLVGNNEVSQPAAIGSINSLYQSVENLTPNDLCNAVCKQMLLHPRNPCQALCSKLLMNVDDTEPAKLLVCDSCNKLSTFSSLDCTCGKPISRQPQNLDSQSQGSNNAEAKGGVFAKEKGSMFLVFDDLKIVPSSLVTSVQLLLQLGYTDLTRLEELTQNIGKQEILNLLKYTLTTHEPLTNTILESKTKKDIPLNPFASAIRVRPAPGDSKMDVKLVRSKSQNKIIFAEAKEDFVDFMFSFLTIPLGSIVKLLGGNSLVGCVDNLYNSVETLDSSWCTDSQSVLLNPGVAPQFGCPNQPLNIPDVEPPQYYYGTGVLVKDRWDSRSFSSEYYREEARALGVISKSSGSIANVRSLATLDPRSPNRLKEDVVGFVKRPALYAVGDDLKVIPLTANSCLSYLKELSLPLDDLEVKVLSIGEAEALSLLGASLTSKYALTSGLEDFSDVPKRETNLTSKYTQTGRLDGLLKEPKPET